MGLEHHHDKSCLALILLVHFPHSSAGGRAALGGHSLAKSSELDFFQHFFLDIHNVFKKKNLIRRAHPELLLQLLPWASQEQAVTPKLQSVL